MELVDGGLGFEIRDFSLASPWEKLAASLEALLRRWAAVVNEASEDVGGEVLQEMVEHERREYVVSFHRDGRRPLSSQLDLSESPNDFSPLCHPLARWFGVSSFITADCESLADLDDARLVLSSLAVALDNAPLPVPAFVSFGRARPRDYLGYMVASDGGGATVQFTAVGGPTARRNPSPSLDWLLDDFARRAPPGDAGQDVHVTVHCSWRTTPNPHGGWLEPVALPPGSYHQEAAWGPDLDPVMGLELSTTCQLVAVRGQVAEERAGEDPEGCPHWTLACEPDPAQVAPLSDSVRMLLQAMSEGEGFRGVRDVVHNQRLGRSLLDPLLLPRPDEINRMVAELFSPVHPACAFFERDLDLLLDVKSAPPLTLLASLCMYMLNLEGLGGVAVVWLEFVRELRFHWDHFTELPRTGVPLGGPHRFCKLFQRLQMLNWCIRQCRDRNETAKKAALGGWGEADFDSVSSGSEDAEAPSAAAAAGPRPQGVKRELDLWLLGRPEQHVNEPITQDQGVATTEDLIEEQERLLVSLGSDERGSEMRAQMQSRSLLSDMEAFRAANPGCELEDFVRWHSPKDWCVEDGPVGGDRNGRDADGWWRFRDVQGPWRRGRLSARMREAGNLWNTLWAEAKPVPASRQKPLVDHVRVGEQILSQFENASPFQLLQECALVSLTSAWHMFRAYPAARVPAVSRQIDALAAALIEVGGLRGARDFGPEDLEAAVEELRRVEGLVSTATSLLCKLGGGAEELVNALLSGARPVAVDPAFRPGVFACLCRALAEDQPPEGGLPLPQEREYLMRTRRTRVYASVKGLEHMRIAAAHFA